MGRKSGRIALRVEAYGTVDELNSVIGLVRVNNETCGATNPEASGSSGGMCSMGFKINYSIWGEFWPPHRVSRFRICRPWGPKDVAYLEQMIDECQKDLAPLKEFILPGGGHALRISPSSSNCLSPGRATLRQASPGKSR